LSFLTAPSRRKGRRFALQSAIVGITSAALVGGVAQTAYAAMPTGPTTTGLTGARPNATALPFRISDEVAASVDVATGNLLVTTQALALPSVNSTVLLGQTYNSLGWQVASSTKAPAHRWSLGLAAAGSLSEDGANVVYTGADGVTWKFTPVAGSSTAFTSSAGFKQDLVKTSDSYTLTDRTSRQVVTFDADGVPMKVADRNGNSTVISTDYGIPYKVVSAAGPTGARTANLAYNPTDRKLTITQTANASNIRTATYQKDATGNLINFTDAAGKATTFGYSGSDLTSITSPTGAVTNFTYDGSTHMVTKIDQLNTTAGSPGTSTTRLTYPSSAQTLVAGPNTDPAVAVATVPHTTYTINPTQELVLKAVDAAGREKSKTYTANADTLTATVGATGGPGTGTSTGTYGANSGNSLTKAQSPGGAADQATYGSTTSTAYLPASTTDSDGNTSLRTFNGAGNQLTTADAAGATATLAYNTNGDGTVTSATAPGNGSNKTVYVHNSDKQLSTVTPVTGSSLGVKTYTYDAYGRIASATDGRGNTTQYTYDKIDRLLTTVAGTATVTNTYDEAGNLTKSVSPTGTITNTFDKLNRQLTTANTAGGSETYTYDKASNEVSSTDSFGTFTNTFDESGVLTSTEYPKNGTYQTTRYATDAQGRRTDTWLQSTNPDNSTWAGHEVTSYDTSGRVKQLTSSTNDNSGTPAGIVVVFDTVYCYNEASAAPTCGTGAATDRAKLQWSKNNLTNQVTAYTYDTSGRVTQVAQSGGTDGNSTFAFTYDARGNRLTQVVTGSNPSSQTLTYNAANQITTAGYTYDGTGHLTATPTATYTYNRFQQMTSATIGGVTSTYTYAGADQKMVLTETVPNRTYKLGYGKNDANGNPQVTTYTVNGNGAHVYSDPVTGQALMLTTSTGVNGIYVWDGLGNPVGLLVDFSSNVFSYEYDPYGVQVLKAGGTGNGAAQNPYAFKAGINDRASGLVKFGYRWYNPVTGTWTQQDTLDSPLDPGNGNRYGFAAMDPINLSDPTGSISTGCAVLGGISAGAGLVGGVSGAITLGLLPSVFGWVPSGAVAVGAFAVAGVAGAGAYVVCNYI
jgi:RHS repeat-associated protein